MLVLLVSVVIAGASLWVGFAGILAGRRMAKQRDDGALMHYPVPIPWMRGRLNTARRVTATGQFYMTLGLFATGVSGVIGLSLGADKEASVCEAMAPVDAVSTLTGQKVVMSELQRHGPRCTMKLSSSESNQWLVNINITEDAALIGAAFKDQKTDLERSSYSLRPLPRLGKDALLAWHSLQPAEAIFLFRIGTSTARVTLQATLNATAAPEPWIAFLAAQQMELEMRTK